MITQVNGIVNSLINLLLLTVTKAQNPQLMEEVRLFDKTSLDVTPNLKRNLQPVSVFTCQVHHKLLRCVV